MTNPESYDVPPSAAPAAEKRRRWKAIWAKILSWLPGHKQRQEYKAYQKAVEQMTKDLKARKNPEEPNFGNLIVTPFSYYCLVDPNKVTKHGDLWATEDDEGITLFHHTAVTRITSNHHEAWLVSRDALFAYLTKPVGHVTLEDIQDLETGGLF